MDSAALQVIQDAVFDVGVTRYAQLAASCMTVYDYIITFDQEYRLIWRKNWSFTKILFLVFRYLGLAVNFIFVPVILETCFNLLLFQSWGTCVVIWLSQIILQGRVWALHNCDKRVLAFLVFLFVAEITAMGVILGVSVPQIQYTNEPLPGFHVCSATGIPSSFFTFWIPTMVFESILMLLAVWGGLKTFFVGRQKWDSERLAHIIIRDNMLYFVATFSIYLINAIVWLTQSASFVDVPEGFSVSITCIVGARLMLNLRGTYYLPEATRLTQSDGVNGLRALHVPRPPHTGQGISTTTTDFPIPLREFGAGSASPEEASNTRDWRWDEQSGTVTKHQDSFFDDAP